MTTENPDNYWLEFNKRLDEFEKRMKKQELMNIALWEKIDKNTSTHAVFSPKEA